MREYIFLVGRILYALPLIILGSNHFMQLSSMANLASAKGLPVPEVSVVILGLVIILGSISVLVGYRGKIGAWLVAVFLLLNAFLINRFWGMAEGTAVQGDMFNFFKDIIMAGAALMMTQTGTGPFSVDNLNKPKA